MRLIMARFVPTSSGNVPRLRSIVKTLCGLHDTLWSSSRLDVAFYAGVRGPGFHGRFGQDGRAREPDSGTSGFSKAGFHGQHIQHSGLHIAQTTLPWGPTISAIGKLKKPLAEPTSRTVMPGLIYAERIR